MANRVIIDGDNIGAGLLERSREMVMPCENIGKGQKVFVNGEIVGDETKNYLGLIIDYKSDRGNIDFSVAARVGNRIFRGNFYDDCQGLGIGERGFYEPGSREHNELDRKLRVAGI